MDNGAGWTDFLVAAAGASGALVGLVAAAGVVGNVALPVPWRSRNNRPSWRYFHERDAITAEEQRVDSSQQAPTLAAGIRVM